MSGPTSNDRDAADDKSGLVDADLGDERTPRWVKVFGLVALIIVLIVLAVHLSGGGFHAHTLP